MSLIVNTSQGKTGFASKDSPFLAKPALIGDIILDYTFPSYTRLKPIRVTNSSGDIEAIRGSEVRISALCDQSLESASLLLNQRLRIPLNIVDNKILEGRLGLLEEGIYRFEIVEQNGSKNTESRPHKISILNDSFPQINLIKPAGDLIIGERDVVRLEYICSDDYGIKEVTLIYNLNDKENKVVLQGLTGNHTRLNNTYIWEMGAIGLYPGAKLAYHLEVKDNDTVSGPKSTSTKIQYLEILSYEQIYKKIIERLDELLAAVQDLPQRQDRIGMLLEGLEDNQTGKMSKAILDELKGIENMVKEIIGGLFSISQYLPDEFLNSNAFKEIGHQGYTQNTRG